MKWFTLSLLLPCCLLAAPKNGGAEEMARLRMILHNLEQEVSVLQEKLETEESVLETVQDQLANRSNHEQINKLEASHQALIADVQKLAKHQDLLTEALNKQQHQVEQLQKTLQTLLDAVQEKPTQLYTVKSGDSLEKIARHHHTTIQVIKELNELRSDQIRVGQQLKLPES